MSGEGDPPIDAGSSLDGASVGNVLLALHQAKREIINEIRQRSDDLHKVLGAKLDVMSNSVVEKVLSGVTSRSVMNRRGSSRSRASDEKKRKNPPPPDTLPYLDVLVDKDKTGFVLHWTMIVTLLSFEKANPAIYNWIPPAGREYMAADESLLEGVSGLSVLFFSVENYHKWRRYHGKIGKLWSFVLRSSISSAILNVRVADFNVPNTSAKHGRTVPPWLASFGGKKKTAAIVSEVIQCLETTDEMARSSGDEEIAIRRKRMRMDAQAPADEFEAERDYTVRLIRSAMLRVWYYGRSEARKVLVGSVMFLIEKIRTYPRVAVAKAEGYEVVFHPPATAEENFVPSNISQTIWDILLAATRDASDDELKEKNNEFLSELAGQFPSLHITLRYKREVKRTGHSASGSSAPLFRSATEHTSLHQMTATVLTASMSARSIKSVLRTSGLSIRAIHVLAVGLRGFLRQSLHLELSEMEKCAMGEVTCDAVEKDDGDMVSTTPSTGKAAAISLQSARNLKLTMSYAAYCSELDKERALDRCRRRVLDPRVVNMIVMRT